MSDNGVEILFNTSVEGFEVPEDNTEALRLALSTGETLNVDMFLFAAGRTGNTAGIGLEEVGVNVKKRGIVEVNEEYQRHACKR